MKHVLGMLGGVCLASHAMASEPREITATGPQGDLAGTLIPPADDQPVIVIIPGSGPTDRDGNNPLGVTAASYRMLAEALAERGIGSVRIDKRGMFGSRDAVLDPNDVTIGAYADDVHAWVKTVQSETGGDCVWVLGHSEGGLVSLEAGLREGDLCGLILVASVGRPMGDILREQLQSNPANAPILDQALSAIDNLEAGERVSTEGMHPALLGLFAPTVQGFLIDMMARDPAKMVSQIDTPILIVSGGKDLQTPVVDGEMLASGQPSAQFVVIDDMTHVLKASDANDRLGNLATYSDPSLPIHPDLVDAIARFVSDQAPAK